MTIWVDADACPNVIKEILYRAAERMQMPLVLVANQSLRVPPSRFIRTLRVAAGFDVADNEIVRQCEAGDLVITADIPLAAGAIEKGAAALNCAVNVTRQRPFVTAGHLPRSWRSGGWKCNVVVAKCNLLFTLHS